MTLSLWMVFFAVAPAPAQPISMPKPNYCFSLLKAVPNRPTLPKEEAERIQAAHIAHLVSLGQKRWLLAAGPIATPGPIRGILISACKSIEEANEFASADPAVRQGRLQVESYHWTGPTGIGDGDRKEREANPNAQARMAKHSLVIIRNSGEWKMPPEQTMAEHAEFLKPLRESGKLAAGGPIHDSPELLAIFVFRDMPLDEARRTAEKDPLFQAGVTREVLEWWVAGNVLP